MLCYWEEELRVVSARSCSENFGLYVEHDQAIGQSPLVTIAAAIMISRWAREWVRALFPVTGGLYRHGALVVSLGGNAFAAPGESMSMAGQFDFAAKTLAPLAELLATDTPVLVTHGNGPQVGYILTRVEEALGKAYALPLEVCVAESEGEIGYVLQQTLHNLSRGRRPVSTLLTQVVVDADDPAFAAPSKPIGPWFSPLLALLFLLYQHPFDLVEYT